MSQLSEEQRLKVSKYITLKNLEMEKQTALLATGLEELGFIKDTDTDSVLGYTVHDKEACELLVELDKESRRVSIKQMRHGSAISDTEVAGREQHHLADISLAVVKALLQK